MKLFDVYPLFDIEPVRALGSFLWDRQGVKYLDLYGGHAVISVGHRHPYYMQKLSEQMDQICFYSNSVRIPLQEELAEKLGQLSGYPEYNLFLCNSGAEANENAMKLASFHTGRKKIIAFSGSFHGRTSAAVAATDDSSISAPLNSNPDVVILPLNDPERLREELHAEDTAAVIIEGIQGVAGIKVPDPAFLQKAASLCKETGALLILDEVQSGCGRTGRFFAHQHAGICPDLITIAKGMGNGFPVAGVLINPALKARHGMLGTTFGGNHLACAASIAVLDIIRDQNLMKQAAENGAYLKEQLHGTEGVKEVRGQGLMLGIELEMPAAPFRKQLLEEHHIFTGSSACRNTIRLLPSLAIGRHELDLFLEAFKQVLSSNLVRGGTA
jgi:acetylornithine/N-succinyldiaminopimelate aminotransferase